MTLLIFLVSVAAAEWLVRRFEPSRDDDKQAWAKQFLARTASSGPATTPGLHALGQALEAHGHGRAPALGQPPQTTPEPASSRQPTPSVPA